jgi:hypothetical protein
MTPSGLASLGAQLEEIEAPKAAERITNGKAGRMFRLIEEKTRISAVDADDIEIVGAYQTLGHNHWRLYITKLTTSKTGVRVPHNACFWGADDRATADAKAWVETIASLYDGSSAGENNVA